MHLGAGAQHAMQWTITQTSAPLWQLGIPPATATPHPAMCTLEHGRVGILAQTALLTLQ